MTKYFISGCEAIPYSDKKTDPVLREISQEQLISKFAPEALAQLENTNLFQWQECHGGRMLYLEIRKQC